MLWQVPGYRRLDPYFREYIWFLNNLVEASGFSAAPKFVISLHMPCMLVVLGHEVGKQILSEIGLVYPQPSRLTEFHRIPRDSQFLGLRSGLILRQIPQRCVTYSHLDGLILTLASWTWIFQRVRNHHTLLYHNTSKALSTSIITHLHRIMNACNCMYLYICILCICNVM